MPMPISNLDYDTLNPHFEYIDEDKQPAARGLVPRCRDGAERVARARAHWACRPSRCGGWARKTARSGISGTSPAVPIRCRRWEPCSRATTSTPKGDGEIIRVTGLPKPGKRTVEVDTDEPDPRKKLIIDEHMDVYPNTYTIQQYGYHPNQVALSLRRRTRSQVDAAGSSTS